SFNDKTDGARGGIISQDGVQRGGQPQLDGRDEENNDIDAQDNFADGEAAPPEGIEREDFNPIERTATAHGEAYAQPHQHPTEYRDEQFIGSNRWVGHIQQADAEQNDAAQGFPGEWLVYLICPHDNQRQVSQHDDVGDVEAIYFVDKQRDTGYPAIKEVVGYQKTFQGKAAA